MNHFTKLAGLGLVATLFLASCEKDEDRVVMQPGSTLSVTSSTNSAVLIQDNASAKAITYTWNAVDFGFQAATSYTLQFDKKGGDFSAPVEIEAGTSTSQALTVAELNGVLLRLKISPGSAGAVDVRVKAAAGGAAAPVLSTATTFTGTPYKVFIQYPSIYVPGSYQDWSPEKAPFLASVNNDKTYEGYVNFPSASTKFKFTAARNWDTDYGVDAAEGTLKVKGGDITAAEAGYYRVQVDLNTLKYTLFKTTWGIVGDATPGGWGTDTPLVYDAAAGVWKATVALKAGPLKFRSNRDWAPNPEFGDNTPVDGIPDYGGENITVATAGTYTVTLDLSQGAGNYSYSIEK